MFNNRGSTELLSTKRESTEGCSTKWIDIWAVNIRLIVGTLVVSCLISVRSGAVNCWTGVRSGAVNCWTSCEYRWDELLD